MRGYLDNSSVFISNTWQPLLINVTFTAKKQGKYVITIADAQNKVLEIKTGISVNGNNVVRLNTSKYAKGVYFITVADKENGQQGKKFIVGEK